MLSQAHRRSIHTSLAPILGEEETDALMSQFPASEADRPVTMLDLQEVRHELRQDFAGLETRFAGLETRFAGLETRFETNAARLETSFANLEMKVEGRMAKVETAVERTTKDAYRQILIIVSTVLVAAVGFSAAIGAAVAEALGTGASP